MSAGESIHQPIEKNNEMMLGEFPVIRLVSLEQIIEMLPVTGICTSIYISQGAESLSVPFEVRVRAALSNAMRQFEPLPASQSLKEAILERLDHLTKTIPPNKERGSFAIFCADGFTRTFWTTCEVRDSVHVGNEFYITPLLSTLSHHTRFYVLALSQKHVRLLKCIDSQISQVELPASLPQSLDQAGAFDAPDHQLENRSAAGPSSAARRRIHFGTGSAEKKLDAYLSRFFRILDDAVRAMLASDLLPLILTGVDRETALYRKVSKYPHLLGRSVHGSPEGVSDANLCRLASEALEAETAAQEKHLQAQFAETRAYVLRDLAAITTAAQDGQISHLLASRGQDGEPDDNLLNHAVVETIRHGGKVSLIASSPASSNDAIAMLRYRPKEENTLHSQAPIPLQR